MTDEDNDDPNMPPAPILDLSDEELQFIRDEGLDLLTVFRKIRDRHKRDLVLELARAIAEAEPRTNGKGADET